MKKTIAIALSLILVFAVASLSFASDAKKEAKTKQVTGEVTAVDAKANTLAVKKDKEETKLMTDAKTKVMAGKDAKTLADVKVGDKVTVHFTAGDKNMATRIELKAAPAPAPAPAAPAKKSTGGY